MRKLLVIGIGAGNPDHMTVQAISGLNRADVLFIPDKGEKKNDLAELRRQICDRFVTNPKSRRVEFDVPVRAEPAPSYRSTVDDWHDAIAAIYESLIRDEIAEDGCGAFLIWGDPSLYDSALRILERVRQRGNVAFELEVIPGITAVQALAASHKMALNRIGDFDPDHHRPQACRGGLGGKCRQHSRHAGWQMRLQHAGRQGSRHPLGRLSRHAG